MQEEMTQKITTPKMYPSMSELQHWRSLHDTLLAKYGKEYLYQATHVSSREFGSIPVFHQYS